MSADIVSITLLNLDYLLVGRYLGAEALGVYTLAFRLPDLIVLQFARSLSTVIFPVYSKIRDVPGGMSKGFFMTTRYISLITVPMGLGLMLIAKPFTLVFFSEKWLDVVPALQGIAVYSMLLSLSYNAGGAYKASGRPQIIIWTGLFRLALLLPSLLWAVTSLGSIKAVSWVHAAVALAGTLLNMTVASKLIDLPLRELASALKPALISGVAMLVAVFLLMRGIAAQEPQFQLIAGVSFGGVVYLGTLWLFQKQVIWDALSIARKS